MARPEGVEPPAYRFEACRSIQLSYGRVAIECSAGARIGQPAFARSDIQRATAWQALMSRRTQSFHSRATRLTTDADVADRIDAQFFRRAPSPAEAGRSDEAVCAAW